MKISFVDTSYADAAWERIKAARDAQAAAGFTYNGITYDSDPVSVGRINAAVTTAILAQSMGQPYSIDWTVADNSVVTLDGPGMMSMGLACAQHVGAQFDRARALRDKLAAATTKADIDAVTWS